MAHNWNRQHFSMPSFQDNRGAGSYNGSAAQGQNSPTGPIRQNSYAFQQNAQLPSINPLSNTDPAHIAALLQQLQAAGYHLPPIPSAPVSQQQPSLATGHASSAQGYNAEDDLGNMGRDVSEEGELSEGEEEDASEYDPAKMGFSSHAAVDRQDEISRRRLSDERRYDRYNNTHQTHPQAPYEARRPQVLSRDSSRAVTPRDFRRASNSPAHLPNSANFRNNGQQQQQYLPQQQNGVPRGAKPVSPTADPSLNLDTTPNDAASPGANELIEAIIYNLGSSSAQEKTVKPFPEQSSDARNFISLLTFYGVAFPTLIQETSYFNKNTDWQSLASVYEGLNISVPPKQSSQQIPGVMGQAKSRLLQDQSEAQEQPKESVTSDAVTSASGKLPPLQQAQPAFLPTGIAPKMPQIAAAKPATATAAAEKAATTAPPSAARPADNRAAYLAKLKAAKMKVGKPGEGAAKSASASATPPVQLGPIELQTVTEPFNMNATSQSTAETDPSKEADEAAARAQMEADARKKRQNEILQSRLAALKAKQAAATPVKPTAILPPSIQTASSPQTPVVTNGSPVGGIPGLFMGSVTAPSLAVTPQPPAMAISGGTPSNSVQSANRKRPVAADFEDFSASPPRPSKQVRSYSDDQPDQYEPMVIEVSDDEVDNNEEGGVGIDDDDVTQFIRSTANAAASQPTLRTAMTQLPGPLTDIPPPGLSSNASSLQGTPGGVGTPQQLSTLELQLAETRAKLAAREALLRRKQLNGSRPQTPQKVFETPKSLAEPTKDVTQTMDAASITSPPVPQIQTDNIPTRQPQSPLVQHATKESASSATRSESPAEHRTRRKADMQSIDARMVSNTSRMEQLRQEMARLQAENERELQEKAALQQELETLGVDTEGMEKDEMEAVRDDIRQQQATTQDRADSPDLLIGNQVSSERGIASSTPTGNLQIQEPATVGPGFDPQATLLPHLSKDSNTPAKPAIPQGARADVSFVMPGLRQPVVQAEPPKKSAPVPSVPDLENDDDAPSESDDEELYATGLADQQKLLPVPADEDDFEMSDDAETSDSATSALPPVTRVTPPKASDHHASNGTQIEKNEKELPTDSFSDGSEDGDDFYEPDSAPVQAQSAVPNGPVTSNDITAPALEETASDFEMSEDEYEPEAAEHEVGAPRQASLGEVGNQEPVNSIVQQGSDSEHVSSGESTDADDEQEYEPTEVQQSEVVDSPSDSSVSQSPQSSAADDLETSVDEDDNGPSTSHAETATNAHAEGAASAAHRLASELQPAQDDALAATSLDMDQSHYQPYQSPLRIFKDYRYHPQYSSDVQGGYRSMTYSHQIDANRPLCPYESDGGICNDPDCQGQHFRGMQLNDDMVLVQLGRKNPGRTEQEKIKWNDGLREVILQLRLSNTRDPDKVAAAIANYRRRFLDDPTKVLHM